MRNIIKQIPNFITTLNLSSGVIAGDRVYIDPSTAEYADIVVVSSETLLKLNANLFSAGAEDYYLYHQKTLTSTITLNGETIGENSAESERLLSCKIIRLVDRAKR